ncbi:MAG: Mov34/MPN/PAD-1 family protein [Pirellulaceae bacterium]|nr:Mov34/MPN/PAD-1 family protein [Pirellulaceae bacterium]
MDDEIHFGEVEHASTQRQLRPDRNKHFAVAAYETPREGELPIFVDLDVLRDMERHAASDTSVELGGVLLGGQFEDDEGRPFVVITDSLRAEHYESTKGSFKFTHDTWSAISRERDQFPAELAMVGWYHTHPDWGVFLSHMDLFICDHFFNKPLDVALVIDPCRGDRGMFEWTAATKDQKTLTRALSQRERERERIRRTGGFYVTASRFRADELQQYVAELCGMPSNSERGSAVGYPAPVVHLHQPAAPPPPPWQGPAMVGVLVLQFTLLAILAWKAFAPGEARRDGELAAALDKLHDSLTERSAAETALRDARAKTAVLDQVVAELRGTEGGFVERLQEKFDQSERLSGDVAARAAQIRELEGAVAAAEAKLKAEGQQSQADRERLGQEIGQLQATADKLQAQLDAADQQIAALAARLEPAASDKAAGDKPLVASDGGTSVWWYVLAGVLAALVIVPGAWLAGKMLTKPAADETLREETAAADQPEGNPPALDKPSACEPPANPPPA